MKLERSGYFVWREGPRLSPETSIQSWIRRNFWLSVWTVVAFEVFAFAVAARDPGALAARYPGFYLGRVVAGGLAVIAIELLLWFQLYRYGGREARWAAGLMGVFFCLVVFVQLMRASIDVPISGWATIFIAYVAASHLGYAFVGGRMSLR